jgi:hypothetical protein
VIYCDQHPSLCLCNALPASFLVAKNAPTDATDAPSHRRYQACQVLCNAPSVVVIGQGLTDFSSSGECDEKLILQIHGSILALNRRLFQWQKMLQQTQQTNQATVDVELVKRSPTRPRLLLSGKD